MLRKLLGLSAAVAVLATAISAQALTVTNRDVTEHALKIAEGDSEQTVMIQPDETLSDVCAAGCTISLNDGDAMAFDGTETAMIEGGELSIEE